MHLVEYKLQKLAKLFFISGLLFFVFLPSAFAGVESSLNNWAKAWSSQDVDLYLERYSDEFLPPKGLSLEKWRQERKIKLINPDFIKVDLSDIKINYHEENFADIEFIQNYQSNTYTDTVKKSLSMQNIEGDWLIVAEKVIEIDQEIKSLAFSHDVTDDEYIKTQKTESTHSGNTTILGREIVPIKVGANL